jgi:hypothetical protein
MKPCRAPGCSCTGASATPSSGARSRRARAEGLPSTRDLAASEGVARNTALRVYDQLFADGQWRGPASTARAEASVAGPVTDRA